MLIDKQNVKQRTLSLISLTKSANLLSSKISNESGKMKPLNIPKLKIPRQIQLSNIISSKSKYSSSSRASPFSSSRRKCNSSEQSALMKKIDMCNCKLETLYGTYKQKCKYVNELTLSKIKSENEFKLDEIKDHYAFLDKKMLYEIEYLKGKLCTKENNTILLEQHIQRVNNENLNYKNKKLILLDKLIEYRTFISKLTKSNRSKINDFINGNDNSNYSSRVNTTQNQYENYLSSQCTPKEINPIFVFNSKFLVNK